MKQLALTATLILSSLLSMHCQSDTSASLLKVEVSKFFSTSPIQKTPTKNVTIAGLKSQDIREAPGSILIIDRQEILASGARDIMEVLAMVPGFNFGRDVDDVIGLGIRGQWAHEGKFLIMYNGLPLNELDFGTFAFSKRINIANIAKIEIMLGAGSVIYGGTAALGVINIIILKPGENDGSSLNAVNAYTKEGLAYIHIGFEGNHYLGNETFVSYFMGMTEGNKTNSSFSDYNGMQINYSDSTDLRSSELFGRIQRKGLAFQLYSNDYNFNVIDGGYRVVMRNTVAEITQSKKIDSKHTFIAKASYQFQLPWYYENTYDLARNEANTSSKKINVSSLLASSWNRKFQSTIGLQAYSTFSKNEFSAGIGDMSASTRMLNAAGFADLTYRSKLGIFNAALRGEVNNMLAPQMAPRVAYNKIMGKFHFKASMSKAFRLPTILNIKLGPDNSVLKVERTHNRELQLGVDLSKEVLIQANFFQTEIKNPIVYVSDSIVLDAYINRTKVGSRGIEFKLNVHSRKLFLNIGYSFYKSRCSINDLAEVLTSQGNFLAFPNHRIAYSLRYQFTHNLAFNAHGSMQTINTSFELVADSEDKYQEVTYPMTVLAGVDFDFHFPKLKDFKFRFGLENILDSKQYIASPYNSGLAAIRMNGRELKLQLSYQITK